MRKKNKRTTINFDPELHRHLRLKASLTSRSMSELVNDAVRVSLAGKQEDDKVLDGQKSEAQRSFDEMVEQLKRDGFILD